jgi:NTE family protein
VDDTQATGISATSEATHPVTWIPRDTVGAVPQPGTALCLSGGGYRAMLFHLGALWRLNELGYLPRLDRVSSVSGGSMTAGVLGAAWSKLDFDSTGRARNFTERVVTPIRRLADTTIDVWAVVLGWLGFDVASRLRTFLGETTLQDLPDRPQFVFNASNIQSGALWRFRKSFAWDWRVGRIDRPKTPLAVVVAASAAFPPVLSPVVLHLRNSDFVPGSGDGLQHPPFTTRVVLTDGGVYDNLGLETAWKQFDTILVSNGGVRPLAEEHPAWDWFRHTARVIGLIHNQVSSVRIRQVISSFQTDDPTIHRKGTYWGIGSDIQNYAVPNRLTCPVEATARLAETPTRLRQCDALLQEQLINWGYAIADAAMRKHVDPTLTAPETFPYKSGVGSA